MSTFVLDDDHNRLRKFRMAIPSAIMAETADEAIEALSSEESWSAVFLDHDLGGEVFVDSSEHNTGMTVAQWMIDNGIKADVVVVHSMNEPAAKEMQARLQTAGYHTLRIPFYRLDL